MAPKKLSLSPISQTLVEWGVTVFISNGDETVSAELTICEVQSLSPPQGGECTIVYGEDGCGLPFDELEVQCSDWEIPCGEAFPITTNLFKRSAGNGESFVSYGLKSNSNAFIVPIETTDIYVQLCNLGVCTFTSPLTPIICEAEQEEVVARGLEEVEKRLEGENLEEALQTMLAVGEGVGQCSEVESLTLLVDQYVAISLSAAGGEAANLPDTSVLMELLGIIAENNCPLTVDLLDSLQTLCQAPTDPDVQTFALNFILSASFEGSEDSSNRIGAMDQAIAINECMANAITAEQCGVALVANFTGDSFFYSQHAVTIPQLIEGITLEAPNSTLFLPPNFNDQIAYDYEKTTGDTTVRYSCVIVNIMHTNTILSTGLDANSALLGVTFYVYVNDTSYSIPVGHNGRPLTDVILQLKRQTSETPAEKRFVLQEPTEENKDPQCSFYNEGGDLTPVDCVTQGFTEEYVNCSCAHFSNFGLLFSPNSADDWTTIRIVSVSLFAGTWVFLILFMLLVSYFGTFREVLGFQTGAEKVSRATD